MIWSHIKEKLKVYKQMKSTQHSKHVCFPHENLYYFKKSILKKKINKNASSRNLRDIFCRFLIFGEDLEAPKIKSIKKFLNTAYISKLGRLINKKYRDCS